MLFHIEKAAADAAVFSLYNVLFVSFELCSLV